MKILLNKNCNPDFFRKVSMATEDYVGCLIREKSDCLGSIRANIAVINRRKNIYTRTPFRPKGCKKCSCLKALSERKHPQTVESLFDQSMQVLMKYIHFVEFDTIPVGIIEEIFLPWINRSGLLTDGSCPECWETFNRIALAHGNAEEIVLANLPFGKVDFFSDELEPLLLNLTQLSLPDQGLHDNSGLLDIIGHSERIQKLNLRNNSFTLRGVKKFLSPCRVYPAKLSQLKQLDLVGNPIENLSLSTFSCIPSLSELLLSPSVEPDWGGHLAKCVSQSSHSVHTYQTSLPVVGMSDVLLRMLSESADQPTELGVKKAVYFCSNKTHHAAGSRPRKRARTERSNKRSKRPRTVFEM